MNAAIKPKGAILGTKPNFLAKMRKFWLYIDTKNPKRIHGLAVQRIDDEKFEN